jgi:hypothetical protein
MQVHRKIIDVHDTTVVLELPQSFVNHRVEIIALTLEAEPLVAPALRQPSPALAGKGKTLGDLIGPIVDKGDWSEAP